MAAASNKSGLIPSNRRREDDAIDLLDLRRG
jgi:hypothetical protein